MSGPTEETIERIRHTPAVSNALNAYARAIKRWGVEDNTPRPCMQTETDMLAEVYKAVSALSPPPAQRASSSIDYHQRIGRDRDIIIQAINSYGSYMLNDDYDAQGALDTIIGKMAERIAMTDEPAQRVDDERTLDSGIGWLIERNSMWGCEWFCAGPDYQKRWTKEAHKAIRFPRKDAAIEAHARFRGMADKICSYPFVESGAGDWDYTYTITEHIFGCGLNMDLIETQEKLSIAEAKAEDQRQQIAERALVINLLGDEVNRCYRLLGIAPNAPLPAIPLAALSERPTKEGS